MYYNEYNRPLSGRPYFRNVGLIKVYDRDNNRYSVGEVAFERFDDQNSWHQYGFEKTGIFQGKHDPVIYKYAHAE